MKLPALQTPWGRAGVLSAPLQSVEVPVSGCLLGTFSKQGSMLWQIRAQSREPRMWRLRPGRWPQAPTQEWLPGIPDVSMGGKLHLVLESVLLTLLPNQYLPSTLLVLSKSIGWM